MKINYGDIVLNYKEACKLKDEGYALLKEAYNQLCTENSKLKQALINIRDRIESGKPLTDHAVFILINEALGETE